MKLPKLLIIGHGRHGKDTVAEILEEQIGLKFMSSSQASADIFIYEELKDKYGYKNSTECFEDRSNHRKEWYNLICDYNKDNKTRLAEEILKINDCYVGMRDLEEIEKSMNDKLFDLVIWVDASERLPLEGAESFNIDMTMADVVIYNNGSLEEFKGKIQRLGNILK
jgi:dephospho-CoA kinase